MTTWDSLFPWEQHPPHQLVPETVSVSPPSIVPISTYHTTPLQSPMIDINKIYNESIGIISPNAHTIPFDTHISSQSSLMDIRLAAALSLPQKQARRPAKGNEIAPSKFRPHVPADRRILLWTTPHSLISQIQRDSEISRRLQTLMYEGLLSSTVDDTRQAYGAGLLRFNQFCDAEMIPESSRMPASPTLLGAFVANYIGSGTGTFIPSYLRIYSHIHSS